MIPKIVIAGHQVYDGKRIGCPRCKTTDTTVFPTVFHDEDETIFYQVKCNGECKRFFLMWIAMEAAVGTEMSWGKLGDDTVMCKSCGKITTEDKLDYQKWCDDCIKGQEEYDRKQKEDGFENV